MIYLHLRYCITIWGSASKTTLMPLVKLHKRIVRIIGGCDYRDDTEPIIQEMKLLTCSDIQGGPKKCYHFLYSNHFQNY